MNVIKFKIERYDDARELIALLGVNGYCAKYITKKIGFKTINFVEVELHETIDDIT